MHFKPSILNLSLHLLLSILFSPTSLQWERCRSFWPWYPAWTVFHYLNHILIVQYKVELLIICVCCSNTTCSNSPGDCSTLPQCSCSAQNAGLDSQISESSSLIIQSPLLWVSTVVLWFLTPLLLATAHIQKLANTFPEGNKC